VGGSEQRLPPRLKAQRGLAGVSGKSYRHNVFSGRYPGVTSARTSAARLSTVIALRLLGTIDLRMQDGSVAAQVLSQPKRLALLAFLAVSPPTFYHRRDKVIALFWPDSPTNRARGSLRRSIHFLRQHLGERLLLSRGDEELAINSESIRCDAVELQHAIQQKRYPDALTLYRGDFLDGLFVRNAPDFERWVDDYRLAIRGQIAEAARKACTAYSALGDLDKAVDAATFSLRLEQSEPTLRTLMAALEQQGDRPRAVEVYRRFTERAALDYGTPPSAATRALLERVQKPALSGTNAIAVMPFRNDTGETAYDYFGNAIADQLTDGLSRSSALHVIARSSVSKFIREQAQASNTHPHLPARFMVEGTYRLQDGKGQVVARLTDVTDKRVVWTEAAMGEFRDFCTVQEPFADSICRSLTSTPLPPPLHSAKHAMDSRAYDYYLRAREAMYRGLTREQLHRALVLLRAGLKISGNNALLFSTMGTVYVEHGILMFGGEGQGAFRRAEVCARKAMKLDPHSAEAHFLAGLVTCRRGDIRTGARQMLIALGLNPSHTDALFWGSCWLGTLGLMEAARPLATRLLDLDPLTAANLGAAGWVEWMAGRFESASDFYLRWRSLEPRNPTAIYSHALTLAWAQRHQEAIEVLDLLLRESKDSPYGPYCAFFQFALRGETSRALDAVTPQLRRMARAFEANCWAMSAFHALIGAKEEAIDWLERAAARGFINYPLFAQHDPFLRMLDGEPRFERLLDKIKIEWKSLDF
jgi:DNA-binding SARP family transcriptional activator